MLNFVKTKAKFLSRCSTPVVRSCEPLRQARQNDDREGLVHSRGKYLNPRRTNQESKFDFDAGLYYNIYTDPGPNNGTVSFLRFRDK